MPIPMRLLQFQSPQGVRAAVVEDAQTLRPLRIASVYALAQLALSSKTSMVTLATSLMDDERVAYQRLIDQQRLLPPITHPDPAHCLVSGTGLTHLGSAAARQRMHQTAEADLTDSMRMFRMGVEHGKPLPGKIGVQPEWFYKGDGDCIVPPGGPLTMPAFASDGGEEAEIVGIYLIGSDGTPCRLGFSLGNEFSDHVMERSNYLLLAHSKLRPCSIGPELHMGPLPLVVEGESRIYRDGEIAWCAPFLSGETHMSHSFSNLEHHHFKYPCFRRPGDVHLLFFGAAALSCANGFTTRSGDIFDISVPLFGRPLRNALHQGVACEAMTIGSIWEGTP